MNKLKIVAGTGGPVISRHIYGHFAEHLGHCIYGGLYVGDDTEVRQSKGIRLDVADALKRMGIPNLRWPGGCFADEYHWMDGIGPKESRPQMVNTNWGGVTENNHFGTHDFLDLCELLDCEPYICGNVGSGSVREMSQWVEYITHNGMSPMSELRARNGRDRPWNLRFWGVGNESWGCGGNMDPEYYAAEYKRYQTFCRNYGENKLFKIAGGANSDDYNWTDVLMRQASRHMQGLSLHYYTVPTGAWADKGSATDFDTDLWYRCFAQARRMDDLLTGHSAIMNRYDPMGKVALVVDEWGTWHNPEPGTNPGFLYQQNTLRDALVASLHFDMFHKHCERVRIANIAQTVNVLQAVILTEGNRVVLTPTYHAFEMSRVHQEAERLAVHLESETIGIETNIVPILSASASRAADGRIHISITNIDESASRQVDVDLYGFDVGTVTGRVLTADALNAHNTFDRPEAVVPRTFDGADVDAKGRLHVDCPPRSFVVLTI